jgi:hypothetical protein
MNENEQKIIDDIHDDLNPLFEEREIYKSDPSSSHSGESVRRNIEDPSMNGTRSTED